ncbi:MAG: hypothetical protein ACKVOK_04220 [Flavobacteriales bacterium]
MNNSTHHLLLTCSVIIGMLISLGYRGVFHKAISIGLGISILVVWLDNTILSTISFYSLFVWGILTVIYGLNEKELTPAEKVGIVSMGLMILLSTTFKFQHWPGSNFVHLLFILPIAANIFALLRQKNRLRKEISFMLTWMVYGILEVLHIWTV